jgi:hemolysin III
VAVFALSSSVDGQKIYKVPPYQARESPAVVPRQSAGCIARPAPLSCRGPERTAASYKKSPFHLARCALAYEGEVYSKQGRLEFVMKEQSVVPAAIALPPTPLDLTAEFCRPQHALRAQSDLEERANTWSSALGIAGTVGFALALWWRGDATAGQWTFAASLFVLFLTSTIYHGVIFVSAKEVARTLDHVAIFALIAATYTPFALGPLRTHGGIFLFALEWVLAVIGLCFVLCGGHDSMRISNALYIGMGWLGLFFISGFINHIPATGNGLILAGGVFYTAGVAFYSARQLRFSHLVWHLFVLAGAICHAVAVYAYSG